MILLEPHKKRRFRKRNWNQNWFIKLKKKKEEQIYKLKPEKLKLILLPLLLKEKRNQENLMPEFKNINMPVMLLTKPKESLIKHSLNNHSYKLKLMLPSMN